MAYDHKISSSWEDEFDTIPIEDRVLMRKYFDYKEILEILRTKPEEIVVILTKEPCDKALVEIIQSVPHALVQLEDYRNCFAPVDADKAEDDPLPELYTIDLEALEDILQKKWKSKKWDKNGELINSVRVVTYNGKVKLTADQAREVLLYCGLFGTVKHIPNVADEDLLAAYLKLKPVIGGGPVESHEILLTRKETSLPYCSNPNTDKTWRITLIVIRNTLPETALVTLEGSCLQRHLEPGEKMLVPMLEGHVVAFPPRFCVSDRQLVLQEDSQICAYAGETMADSLQLPGSDPVLLAESGRWGLMIADRIGSFQTEILKNNFRGQAPGKTVFWIRGDLEDYGFLEETGSYQGTCQGKNWAKLLMFDISVGKGIAITAQKNAIDGNGKILAENAAEVSCCGSRWIVLRTDGTVCTDGGELQRDDFPARAVCADDSGYWIATDHRLYRIEETECCYDQAVDEIARNNDGAAVYGRLTDGSFLKLR